MKKLVFTIIAIIFVAVGVALSVQHYKQYQNKKQAQAVPVISVKQADARVKQAQTSGASEYHSLVVRYNKAVAQCKKGVVAYDQLTPYTKTKTAPPVCPKPQN